MATFIVGDGQNGMPRLGACEEDLVFAVLTTAQAYTDRHVLVTVIRHE